MNMTLHFSCQALRSLGEHSRKSATGLLFRAPYFLLTQLCTSQLQVALHVATACHNCCRTPPPLPPTPGTQNTVPSQCSATLALQPSHTHPTRPRVRTQQRARPVAPGPHTQSSASSREQSPKGATAPSPRHPHTMGTPGPVICTSTGVVGMQGTGNSGTTLPQSELDTTTHAPAGGRAGGGGRQPGRRGPGRGLRAASPPRGAQEGTWHPRAVTTPTPPAWHHATRRRTALQRYGGGKRERWRGVHLLPSTASACAWPGAGAFVVP